ncbi:hypothetical protein DNU06_10930 [Putridiphycobacter roseus]|uniref:Uncharacterized protein n=1 Tax=Putridiphycobacter roseus TaxID=2219161 RepID=A0A2W1NFH9_9FLAO|nr:tetratricopeptide repeat protein [Putridiphycobacter roseus]PZE16766.1 hypothetical protein DNU06_10930 [Putridiphycobacter roseus]
MIKTIFSICFIFGLLTTGFGQTELEKGDSAYAAQNYEVAIQAYTSILGNQFHSASLYYNLGNAYLKNNELGKAIWSYQKANKIKPGDEDILFNLDYASGLTKDKIEQRSSGISKWMAKLFYGKPINYWAYFGIGFALITCLFFYFYKTQTKKNIKALYFLFAGISMVLMLLAIGIGMAQKSHITTNTNAIIIQPVVKVKTAPNEAESIAFELHEGARVELIKSEGDWININVNKNQGWVLKSATLLY